MGPVAEAFQRAIDDKVPQLREQFYDDKGGFCVMGLLGRLGLSMNPISDAVRRDTYKRFGVGGDGPRGLISANDDYLWTWEDFLRVAKENDL